MMHILRSKSQIQKNNSLPDPLFWQLLNYSEEAYILSDVEGKILQANKKAIQLFELSSNTLIDSDIKKLTFWEGQEAYSIIKHTCELGKPYTIERNHFVFGHINYLNIQIIPFSSIHDSSPIIIFIFRITNIQKKLQQDLLEETNLRKLIAEVSNSFSEQEDIHEAIGHCLKLMGNYLGAEINFVYEYLEDAQTCTLTHEWQPYTFKHKNGRLIKQELNWEQIPGFDQLKEGKAYYISHLGHPPSEKNCISSFALEGHTNSMVLIPMSWGERLLGFLGFENFSTHREYSAMINLLLFIGRMISTALHRHYIEAALKESKLRYQAVASMTTDIIYHFKIYDDGSHSKVNLINSRLLPDLQIDHHEGYVELKELLKNVYEKDKKLIREAIQTILKGKESQDEIRFVNNHGEIRWMSHYGKPVFDANAPKVIGVIGSLSDITNRKQIEKRLLEKQDRYELAIKGSDVGIWEYDIETKRIYINNEVAQIIGYQRSELLEKVSFWQDIVHPEDIPLFYHLFKSIDKSNPNIQVTYRLRHKNGHWVWVITRGKVWTWTAEGKPKRMVATQFNITKAQEAKEELNVLTNEMIRINNELEQFAYITSHNLRSPVTNLKGLLELFDHDEPTNPLNFEIMNKIDKSVDYLSDVINDLHHITDLQKTEKYGEFVLFSELIGAVKLSLHNQITEAKARIILDLQKAPGLIYYKAYLHSILYNLISNAIKYRSSDRPLKITIKSRNITNGVHLTVSDNGLGIDLTKYGDRIFRIYQRFHPHMEGKGLGLYMLKSQVESLGGKVNVESKPQVGTCFHLHLFNLFQ